MADQHSPADPTSQHPTELPAEQIEHPGRTGDMTAGPDHGEQTYRGSGRLTGKRALITGGDSGIGRAVAIAFAREGADVLIVHLAEEQADGQETVRLVEQAGRKGVAVAGDLRDEQFCRSVVQRTVAELGGLDVLVNNAAYQMMQGGIADITSRSPKSWPRRACGSTPSRPGPSGAADPGHHAAGRDRAVQQPDPAGPGGPARRGGPGVRLSGLPGVELHHRGAYRRDRRDAPAVTEAPVPATATAAQTRRRCTRPLAASAARLGRSWDQGRGKIERHYGTITPTLLPHLPRHIPDDTDGGTVISASALTLEQRRRAQARQTLDPSPPLSESVLVELTDLVC